MKIAFLGLSTDDKRFLILCLAKIASYHTKVSILTKHTYDFDNAYKAYEYCGIQVFIYADEKEFLELAKKEENVFIDAEDVFDLSDDYRIITVCGPTRQELETSVSVTRQYTLQRPSLNVSVIYLNIMEYSRVSKKFMDLYWEQGFPNSARVTFNHAIYFEDINQARMIDSQYSNKVQMNGLSLAFKAGLKSIVQDLFKLDSKGARDLFRKAEREK